MTNVWISITIFNMNTKECQHANFIVNNEVQSLCCSSCPFFSQFKEMEDEIEQLQQDLDASQLKIQEIEKEKEALEATIKSLAHLHFGRSTEKDPFPEDDKEPIDDFPTPDFLEDEKPKETVREPIEDEPTVTPTPEPTKEGKRTDIPEPKKKGKRGGKGPKGHGRKIPEDIPTVKVIIDILEEDRDCDICGIPYEDVPFVESSSTLEIKIIIYPSLA